MSHIMLYIFPLILGRTFDLNTMQVGVDIYPGQEIEKPTVIQNPITETTYKLIDNTEEARDLLDVSGGFSLNVKGGLIKAGASGAYMSDVYNRQNTVEIAVKATFQTVTETLSPSAKPRDDWMSMSGAGTHFVRSIIYGGELIASVRLICNNTRNKQRIKAALEGGGKLEVFDIAAEVEGEYFTDISKSVNSMQIKVYSSVPLTKIPHDMKALRDLLENFSKDVRSYNDGNGVPLKVELWPLEYLNSTRPKFLKNRVLEAHLGLFEQKFDDLLNTKAAVNEWMNVMTETLTEKQEKVVGSFYSDVMKALKPFYEVIGTLDLSKGLEQLSPALTAYGKSLPGSYYQRYLRLRQNMVDDQGEWSRERGSGATYVHWGKTNCSLAETLYSGFASGPVGGGGGSNLLCLPRSVEAESAIDDPNVVTLTGASYQFPGRKPSSVPCSSCRLAARGSVETFVGLTQCPKDWHFAYRGLLLSASGNGTGMDSICLGENPEDAGSNAGESASLVPSWITLGSLGKLLPCVVCSK